MAGFISPKLPPAAHNKRHWRAVAADTATNQHMPVSTELMFVLSKFLCAQGEAFPLCMYRAATKKFLLKMANRKIMCNSTVSRRIYWANVI